MIAGIGVQLPMSSPYLMPGEQPGMLLHLFGLMPIFLGLMLMLCSRDLPRRGVLVAWEGVLRLGGASVLAGYGLFGGQGAQAAFAGVIDLVVGVVYLVGLPRYLRISLRDLLLDRASVPRIGVAAD